MGQNLWELISIMVRTDPTKRPSLETVKAHKWVQSGGKGEPAARQWAGPPIQTHFPQQQSQPAPGSPMYAIADRTAFFPNFHHANTVTYGQNNHMFNPQFFQHSMIAQQQPQQQFQQSQQAVSQPQVSQVQPPATAMVATTNQGANR